MAKLMGIDYGSKRVGLALSDESQSVAFPKGTMPNDRALLRDVAQMITAEGVTDVVIGESKNSQGADNTIAANAKKFGDDLARMVPVTIHYEPEFYSTQEARMHTGEWLVDAAAAAIILNSFITKRRGTPHIS